MKSMTGFGRGSAAMGDIQCIVELKTVNARYCDIFIKTDRPIGAMEQRIRNMIQTSIQRGKVDVAITLVDDRADGKNIVIDRSLKEKIQTMLVEEGFFTSIEDVPFEAVTSVSREWICVDAIKIDESTMVTLIENAMEEALMNLVHMRQVEGTCIAKDLLKRIEYIEHLLSDIECHKDDVVAKYQERITHKILSMIDTMKLESTKERILEEVAIVADKTDITEEIVRFSAHVVQLKNTLTDTNAIGRKLDFLLQEMNREVNTMGSKCTELIVTDRVLQLKCELEKIREQIQNIE